MTRAGRNIARTALSLAFFGMLLSPGPAFANIIANGPDDICAPAADPCVINDTVEVQSPGLLDFGLRAVHITGSGKLLGSVDIDCGSLLVDTGSSKVVIDSSGPNNDAGSVSLTAIAACSGDPSQSCSTDTHCSNLGLGTCSIGGFIDFDGKIEARGNPGGFVSLSATKDITVHGRIRNDGVPIGSEGGSLDVSAGGKVTLNEDVISRSIKGNGNYEPPVFGGFINIAADGDIKVKGALDASGSANGGQVEIDSDEGSVSVHGDVLASAAPLFSEGAGGQIYVEADGDISFTGGGD